MRLIIAITGIAISLGVLSATNQLKRIGDLLEAEAIRVHQVSRP